MQVLMTGSDGYIGCVMTGVLERAGHSVHGIDAGFFSACAFRAGSHDGESRPYLPADVRDARPSLFSGIDAVVHLAALSNDPLGNLDPELTYAINHRASLRIARAARAAGVARFLFASSCSLYGVQGEAFAAEDADLRPVTPYGRSKALVEEGLSALADDDFSPTYLRNATAYGVSPRLRTDIVVNNLVAHAVTKGEVLLKSDGSAWRPLVHVEDLSLACLAALESPRSLVHDRAFNVGRTEENYRVSELAEIVAAVVPGSEVRYASDGDRDARSYRVDCSRIGAELPGFEPGWTVERGVEELRDAYASAEDFSGDFEGGRFERITTIRKLRQSGRLDEELRWRSEAAAALGSEDRLHGGVG